MSSFSLPSPRISGGSQRSSPDHRHFRLSASSRARCKASGSSAKEPASNGAAQSPNRQQATSATKSADIGAKVENRTSLKFSRVTQAQTGVQECPVVFARCVEVLH